MSRLEALTAGIDIEGRWLVREVTLALRPGILTVLVGPNGSGKTTLLRLLSGLWMPSSGRVVLGGRDLGSISRRQLARRIAFVPQDTHLDFAFTVRDLVMMGRHPHLGRFERERDQDRRCVEDAMSRADVTNLADRLVTEISGGERQRVIIARSLATEADVILLDEPTANLDVAHALDVLGLCTRLAAEGKTVALATHDLNAAARFASEVVLLNEGRVVAGGSPADVITGCIVKNVFGVDFEQAVTSTGRPTYIFYKSSTNANN